MAIEYNFSYDDILNHIANYLYNNVDNVTNAKYNSINAIFKTGYKKDENFSYNSGAVKGTAYTTGPIKVSRNDDNIGQIKGYYRISINNSTAISLNLKSANDIKFDIENYIPNSFNLTQKVSSNNLLIFTNYISQFVMHNVKYVVSTFYDGHYLEYFGNDRSFFNNPSFVTDPEIIYAINVLEFKNLLQNHIKNNIKYKLVKYTYSITTT